MSKRFLAILILVIFLLTPLSVQAQSSTSLPVYVVQAGDTINTIAIRFGVSAQDLIDTNQLANPNILSIGTSLKIPGLSGITGTLKTEAVQLGSSLNNLSLQYRIPPETIIRLNKITSPSEIYVGSTLILPADENSPPLQPSSILPSTDTVLESAILSNTNPWLVTILNQKQGSWQYLPSEHLYSQLENLNNSLFGSGSILSIEITPLPIRQGKTQVIKVSTASPIELEGQFNDRELSFFPVGENTYVAIQGVHALAKPGLISFSILGKSEGNQQITFEQSVLLEPGYYAQEKLYVDPQTLDPATTQPEDELVRTLTAKFTPVKNWSGIFSLPVDEPQCIKSWFGTRRSYNDSDFSYFHTGVDYGVCANLNIYSPAAGIVVYVGEMTVRGNATIIDHGLGVYSGFWHQQSTNVSVGEKVESGQLIGQIGGTGRATGPHLHWEVWAGGIQVEPLDWLAGEYP